MNKIKHLWDALKSGRDSRPKISCELQGQNCALYHKARRILQDTYDDNPTATSIMTASLRLYHGYVEHLDQSGVHYTKSFEPVHDDSFPVLDFPEAGRERKTTIHLRLSQSSHEGLEEIKNRRGLDSVNDVAKQALVFYCSRVLEAHYGWRFYKEYQDSPVYREELCLKPPSDPHNFSEGQVLNLADFKPR